MDPSFSPRCLLHWRARAPSAVSSGYLTLEKRMHTVLLVLLVLSNAASQAPVPRPVRVAGPGYEGAIVSAEELLATDPRHVTKPAALWTPTEADIREAEGRLPDYLKSPEAAAVLRGTRIGSELPRYYRQYWGRVVRGQRQVLDAPRT